MSEQTKHTKGPWSVGDTGTRGDGVWVQPSDGNANVICDIVGRINVPEEDTTQITDEDLANAHLIAAAPELLAVCERVVLAAEGMGGYIGRNGQLVKDIRAAINKALGND